MANGHGTLLTGSDGQGNVRVDVQDNGGNKHYTKGSQTAINKTGEKAEAGVTVSVDWSDSSKSLVVTGVKK